MVAPSVDLLALLRPSQVVVAVAGHRFALTATCASHWLGAIATDPDGLYGIMPGLIGDGELDLMAQLMQEHPDISTRWFHAARTALGRAAGRDWWWAWNLSKRALGGWIYINGILVRQGVDAKKMDLPDWLDACYTMLWQGCDEEHQMKLDMELGARPAGVAIRRTREQIRAEMAAFAAD